MDFDSQLAHRPMIHLEKTTANECEDSPMNHLVKANYSLADTPTIRPVRVNLNLVDTPMMFATTKVSDHADIRLLVHATEWKVPILQSKDMFQTLANHH